MLTIFMEDRVLGGGWILVYTCIIFFNPTRWVSLYPYFTNQENVAQSITILAQGLQAIMWQIWDLSWHLSPKSVFLIKTVICLSESILFMEDSGHNSGLWQRDLANLKRILWVEVRGIQLFKRGKLLSRLVLRSHWYESHLGLLLSGLSRWLSGKEFTCQWNLRNEGLIPVSGRSPGRRNGNPLQYSWLENPWTKEPGRLESMES